MELNKEIAASSPKNFELGWKNHNLFFNSLNNKIDEIVIVAEQAHFDTKLMNVYYAKVKHLYTKHSAYVTDQDKVETELDAIGDAIFSEKYLKDFEKYKDSHEIKQFQYKAVKRMDKLFRQMVKDFSQSELIPKPVGKYAEVWEGEKNHSLRARKKAVVDIVFGDN